MAEVRSCAKQKTCPPHFVQWKRFAPLTEHVRLCCCCCIGYLLPSREREVRDVADVALNGATMPLETLLHLVEVRGLCSMHVCNGMPECASHRL